jgi:predicted nuclease with RNAse H fold
VEPKVIGVIRLTFPGHSGIAATPPERSFASIVTRRLGRIRVAIPNEACLGVDLAGVERRETGIAVLRVGRLALLTSASDDDEILAFAAMAGPGAAIAINAPLTFPRGRCCLNDDCHCRHDPGTRSRQAERDLLHLGVPTLATALLKVLARRGIRLAEILRQRGWDPIEVYPYATLRLLGLPTAGKRTPLGRRRIHAALQTVVPGLGHPDASEHQLDAVVCAYTAWLWRAGRTVTVGSDEEGLMIIPDTRAARGEAAPERVRRVAESSVEYRAGNAPK